VPQIEVVFDIDANGILNVTAKDKGTGKEQSISITGASTLPQNEVERMVNEAESNASVDKERRERIERKNQADSLVYQAEKQLAELGDKVPPSEKNKAQGLIKDLKEAIAQDDDGKIKTILPELQQALYAIGSSMYQQGAPSNPPGGNNDNGPSGGAGGGDDVIDAEFSDAK
jgi:molecular chaperone DnaK